MDIKPGSPMSVSYLDVSHRIQSVKLIYVGLVEDEYLILRFPNQKTLVNSTTGLTPGAHLTFRTMLAKERLHMLDFKASSLGISKLREPVLLVQYPQKVNHKQLRAQPRLSVEAMANLKLTDKNIEFLALVSDFSLTGLKCEFYLTDEQENLYNKEQIEGFVEQKVLIDFGVNDDFESDFQITGVIKNARLQDKIMFGIQFNEEEADMVKTVFAILLMRLHGL